MSSALIRVASRPASARQLRVVASSEGRVRQAAMTSICLPVNGLHASIPSSTVRTSAVNALTERVRSLVICSRAITRTRTVARGPSARG